MTTNDLESEPLLPDQNHFIVGAAIHNEYLSVCREGGGHDQRRDVQRILVTLSQGFTKDSFLHFEHRREQNALLEGALT